MAGSIPGFFEGLANAGLLDGFAGLQLPAGQIPFAGVILTRGAAQQQHAPSRRSNQHERGRDRRLMSDPSMGRGPSLEASSGSELSVIDCAIVTRRTSDLGPAGLECNGGAFHALVEIRAFHARASSRTSSSGAS